MSRVSITKVTAGDVLNTTDANKTLDNWASATGSINRANLREEGLDGGCFEASAVRLDLNSFSSSSYTTYNGDYLSVPNFIGGDRMMVGSFDLSDSTTTCIVRASFEIALGASDYSEDPPYGQVAIGYSTDNSTWTLIDETKRNFKFHESVAKGDGSSVSGSRSDSDEHEDRPFEIARAGVVFRGITTIAHKFTSSSSSTVWFGLFLKQNLHPTLDITFSAPYLYVELFGR